MTPVSAFTPLRFFSENGSERRGNRTPRRRQDEGERTPREYKTFTTSDFNTSSVLVVNLPFTLNAQGVKDAFASVGNIEYVKILRRDDGLPLGRAIVRFSEVSSAQAAFDKFNATELPGAAGRKIHLKPAQQPVTRYTVFVSQLPQDASVEQLKEYFGSVGNVVSARIRDGKNDGAVSFSAEEDAQKALQLNGSTFQGASITVQLPTRRSDQQENKVEESS